MIHIGRELEDESVPDLVIETAARAAQEYTALLETDLAIVLAGDEELCRLNREFLGEDAPTDVLSFPAEELDPDSGRRYLGDVAISLPRASAQAAARGHSLEREVQLLVVHGVLHLAGYDHANEGEKERMWQAQSAILAGLGFQLIIP